MGEIGKRQRANTVREGEGYAEAAWSALMPEAVSLAPAPNLIRPTLSLSSCLKRLFLRRERREKVRKRFGVYVACRGRRGVYRKRHGKRGGKEKSRQELLRLP